MGPDGVSRRESRLRSRHCDPVGHDRFLSDECSDSNDRATPEIEVGAICRLDMGILDPCPCKYFTGQEGCLEVALDRQGLAFQRSGKENLGLWQGSAPHDRYAVPAGLQRPAPPPLLDLSREKLRESPVDPRTLEGITVARAPQRRSCQGDLSHTVQASVKSN
ncbi:hypothetical protein [Novosphingobium sp. ZW T3_23]|uniref:hypothetical protein n=1 Tax=Novosphingobium sp. ZW T3_23 TaxID=3378084 RepID=UPI0038522961